MKESRGGGVWIVVGGIAQGSLNAIEGDRTTLEIISQGRSEAFKMVRDWDTISVEVHVTDVMSQG